MASRQMVRRFLDESENGKHYAETIEYALTYFITKAEKEGDTRFAAALKRAKDTYHEEYRRAIELNPNYVTAHSWYAEHLSRMGRHAEAVAEAKRARDLDPLSLVSGMILAWILYFARRYQESIEWSQRTLELDPDYATALRILGWAYEETGHYDEAIAAHQRAIALTHRQPNFAGQLGRAYALAGWQAEARAVLSELLQLFTQTYVSALDIAIIHTALADHDRAFEWLERAYEERSDHLPYLKVNPRFDPLRPDPRFGSRAAALSLGGVRAR